MPIFLIAFASALLLAYLVTEITSRFWAQDFYALLVITTIALLVNGLFNAVLAKRSTSSAQAGNGNKPSRKRESANSKSSNRPAKQRPPRKPAAKPSGKEESGTVKWFNRTKGYGFIIRENDEEIFVHQRSIADSGDGRQRPMLRDGERVSFIVTSNEKGVQAEHVKSLE